MYILSINIYFFSVSFSDTHDTNQEDGYSW